MKFSMKIALASVSLISLAAPAFAAEEGDDAGNADIVVEARRKSESLQDVPLTVNAVTSETITKLNIRDAKDISSVVPGLQLSPGTKTSGAVTSMRGLNVNGNASGNNGTVEFYMNDAPTPAGLVLQALYDVGQVEVLRGPQGTLRGRTSPSGSITVTSKKPVMDEWGGYAMGTASDANSVNLQGAVNLPLVKDVFAVRVAGVVDRSRSSSVKSINNPTLAPNSDTDGVRISARLTPLDGLELNASYNYMVHNFKVWDQVESANLALGTTVVGTLVSPNDYAAVEDMPTINRQSFKLFNWQLRYSFAGLRLDYVGSHLNQDLMGLDPSDKGNFFTNAMGGNAASSPVGDDCLSTTFPAQMNVQNYYGCQHSFAKQDTHEVRLSNEDRVAGMFDFIIGAFYNRFQSDSDIMTNTPIFTGSPIASTNFLRINGSYTPRRGRQKEQALFGNVTAHIGEATEVSGGIRVMQYDENLQSAQGGAPTSHKPVVWSASVKHRFNDDFMVYATAGSSWRVGTGSNGIILARTGVNLNTIVDPYLLTLATLTPETSKSYEIGFRSSFLDKKLTFNVSAFHQDFKNYIFASPPVYVSNNSGTTASPVFDTPARTLSTLSLPVPAKVDGFEVELNYRPSSHLELGASVAYAKSSMSGTIPCTVGTTLVALQQGNATRQVAQCSVSQSASLTAPFSAILRGEFSQPVGDKLNAFVRGLVNFTGKNQNDPQNLYDDVPSYALANLYLGVRSEDNGWEISAYAKNLFNVRRVLTRDSTPLSTRYAVGASASSGVTDYRGISMNEPRELGITARIAFGSR